MRNCPKCKSNRFKSHDTNEGVVVDFCGDCGAIWFENGELALFTETDVDVPYLTESLKTAVLTSLRCPMCPDENLVEIFYHPQETLKIDFCRRCRGTALDKKEIPAVEAINAKYRLVRRFERIIKELKHQGYVVLP